VAYISPGFASDSVKYRPEETTDDFTGTGSYASSSKQPSNTPSWDTQKGIADNNELFVSGELKKRLELKPINLEKHLSKKVAHLLKSRPSLLASFHEELKDTRQRSSKTLEPELEHNVFSSMDVDSGTGEAPGAEESTVVPTGRSQWPTQDNQTSVPSVEAPKEGTIKKENIGIPRRPNTVLMKKIHFVGQVYETQKGNGSTQKISKKIAKLLPSSGSRWSSILMPHGKNGVLNLNVRLDSLGNHGLLTKKRKRHKSETESGGAIVRVLKTLFFFGGLLVVLMMFACFAFAW